MPADVRPGRDLVHAEVLAQQQVADRVDRVEPVAVITSPSVRPSHAQVLGPGEVAEPDVAPGAGAGEQARRARRARRGSSSRTAASARRSFSGPGPPAWTQGGSMISSRVLAHS